VCFATIVIFAFISDFDGFDYKIDRNLHSNVNSDMPQSSVEPDDFEL